MSALDRRKDPGPRDADGAKLAMPDDLAQAIDVLKHVWFGLFQNMGAIREHDLFNWQGAQDRLARGQMFLEDMERKYGLPHFEWLDRKY